MIQNQDFIHEFVEEAKSHIEKVEASLLKKGEMFKDSELINDIFRAVHSIKGTAGFFGLKKIVSLAHAMENVFAEIRTGKKDLNEQIADLMLESNDCLRDMVEDILNSEEAEVSSFVERLDAVLAAPAEGKKQQDSNRITITDSNSRKFDFTGGNREMLIDAVKHGHKLYELKLRMNKDLLKYNEGPVKLFKKIQALGQVIDTVVDHSEINSFEDILQALDSKQKDVYLGIIISTVLEKSLLVNAIEIPAENIHEMSIEKQVEQQDLDENKVLNVVQSQAVAATPDVITKKEADDKKATKKTVETENKQTESKPAEQEAEKQNDGPKQLKMEDSIRVHVSVLNDLLNMASEMVLGRNQLLRTLEDYRKGIPGLSAILQNVDRLTSGMQEKIMQTRMQPIANVFSKFPRIIRDLSKSLGKSIELQLEGEEVELDKSVIEALADPLTHLVRNAADHGLEDPETREGKGKPRTGVIKLKAYHEGGYANIDVIDDGAGIDASKLAKKAIDKGVVTKEEVSRMSEQDLLKLIFKPGFSTAEKVSDISGRGVGMDVVRTNIEKLGGSIEIISVINSGTTIRLMLPLTLAIIQSLIVEVEGQKFALPQVNLKEIVRIRQGDKTRKIEYLNNSEVLRLRGKLLPIVHLAEILGIKRTYIDPSTGERKPERRKAFSDALGMQGKGGGDVGKRDLSRSLTRILVLQMGTRYFGLAVDSIFTSEETLVKPLPVYLKNCDCYSGVTIMGDGKTAMILDVEGLIRISGLKFGEELEALSKEAENLAMMEAQDILLFKCSGNENYGIDLSMVSRVEEIKASDIEKVGNKEYIMFRGDSLRVIRPEEYLPVNRSETSSENKYVLIPKLVSHPIGIIAEKIIDNVNTNLALNTEDVKINGLLGTAIYEDRMILLLNIYKLFEEADPEHYPKKASTVTNKGTLLLVEDTPFFQRLEKEYLEGAGFEVMTAFNGKEALTILETCKVDVVVSDIQMPVMDGMELVKKIRENAKLSSLPVIAVTSMSGEQPKQQAYESGFNLYEMKLDRDRLIKAVRQVMKKEEKVVV